MSVAQLALFDGAIVQRDAKPENVILSALDRDQLAPLFLAAEIGSADYEELLNALSTKDVPRPPKETP